MRLPLLLAAMLAAAPFAAVEARSRSVDEIYGKLEAASRQYLDGQAKIRAGEIEEGQRLQREASAALLQAGNRCEDVRGCDTARFLAAYDALLKQGGDVGARSESSLSDVIPESGRSITLLRGRELRDVIELNEPVRAAMGEWLTSLRPFLMTAYENYAQMRFLMLPEYQQAGLPEALLFGIMAKESGGKVHSISRSGAAGPLQFMPATGMRFGLGWREGFDTRYDPQLSARANALYFNERFAELNNNLELAIAAYNGGEGRALRIHQASGGADFWTPQVYGALPPETRDYVPFVLAAAYLFLHPEEYGLEFPKVEGAATVLKLERSATLVELAVCLGNGGTRDGFFRPLRNLNAQYEHNVPIAAGSELRVPVAVPPLYRQHCVQGDRAVRAAAIANARMPVMTTTAVASVSARPASTRTYRVERGDTLASIVRRFQCDSTEAVARANRLRAPGYMIRPGQRLRLSGCSG